jgi:hypothetical protein
MVTSSERTIRGGSVAGNEKKVPSDPSVSLFYAPACTARTWHPQRGDVSPSLPAAGFGRLRIDVPVLAHSAVPVEARSSMPPFTLRLRKPALRRVSTAGERSWPASSKRSRNLRPARSVSRSRLRQSPANPAENVPRTKPVAGSDPEIPCVPPGFRSPPGPLDPSGSMPQPGFKQRSLPLRAARFAFAPRYAENSFNIAGASDRRSGFAASRQARCPSNLLEPSS